ncbi:MAG: DUF2802 domain-containing protein [Deltaproteobacteria bacterium]|nr:DUF2802 domain-containing protein [Deltaproteobacteria bacterium]
MELTTVHFVLIIGFDILIVGILLLVFFRSGRTQDTVKELDVRQIKGLYSTLEKAMSESSQTSYELLGLFDEKITALKDVLEDSGKQKRRLEKRIAQAEEVISSISSHEKPSAPPGEDVYQRAAELIAKEVPEEKIQSECGLSLNEIDLIKQLSINKNA